MVKTSDTGLFIVLDGIDGCGKGTQSRMLVQRLYETNKRHHIFWTREPSRSAQGVAIRDILKSELDPFAKGEKMTDLFVDDRREHVMQAILPVLAYGGIVVSDRYKYSTLCYQTTQLLHEHMRAVGAATFDELSAERRNQFSDERERLFGQLVARHADMPVPDLTLIVDVPVAVGLSRVYADPARKHSESFETVAFQTPLREMYLSLPPRLPEERIIRVDGTLSKEQVAADIWRYVEPLLEKVR